MKNLNIKRDQIFLESLVSKYGKSDILKYINRLNEDFENTFDSSLVDYSKDFEQQDINYIISNFKKYLEEDADWDMVGVELRYSDDAPCSWDHCEDEVYSQEEFYEMRDKYESWADEFLMKDGFEMILDEYLNEMNKTDLLNNKNIIESLQKIYNDYVNSKAFDEDFVCERFGPSDEFMAGCFRDEDNDEDEDW